MACRALLEYGNNDIAEHAHDKWVDASCDSAKPKQISAACFALALKIGHGVDSLNTTLRLWQLIDDPRGSPARPMFLS